MDSGNYPRAPFGLSTSISADQLLNNLRFASAPTDDSLRYVTQLYEEKQANLLLHFQQAQQELALQHMRQMQRIRKDDDPVDDLPSPVQPPSGSDAKLRRSYSGSGATISDQTREKLKTMLVSKQQRRKGGGAVSSPHFEPYPLRLGAGASEFELRKVSSEPNLKMRSLLRAKLLNRTHNHISPPMAKGPSAFQAVPHRHLTRSESDGQATPPLAPLTNHQPSVIVPAPSLPNLHTDTPSMPVGWDLTTALWAQTAALSAGMPCLSMPSLLGLNNSLPMPVHAWNPLLMAPPTELASGRAPVKLDSRSFTSPLPVGGQPSLLKQQLRDLVLRRKSLVREETETEVLLHTHVNRKAGAPKTGLAYDSSMCKHGCLCGNNQRHVEHGGRVHSVWARLAERGLVENCERVAARKAPLDQLRLAHSDTYVTFFGVSPTACLKMDPAQLPLRSFVQLPCGGIGVDSDTYFNDSCTPLAARLAVGALTELCVQVAEGKLCNGFAVIRPPGHHAERDQAMGFCYFNNVAIAARCVQQRSALSGVRRIAIVDWDVHHGNGTQLAFETDPSVLYLSLHRHDNGNFFPGTGAVTDCGTGAGKGFSVNVPFSGAVMGDAEYLAAWRVVIEPILGEFAPDLVIVSAGFDGAKGHPPALGGYDLTPALFGYMTRQLMKFANGKVVLSLEGGYELAAICDASEECVKVLCSADTGGKLSDETLNRVPNHSAQETIQKVVAVHKKHWSQLTGDQGLAMSEAEWEAVHARFASLSVKTTSE